MKNEDICIYEHGELSMGHSSTWIRRDFNKKHGEVAAGEGGEGGEK